VNAPICLHAGPKAMAQIKAHGLRAQDIAVVPAAAGGPKGLILQAIDQWLFGEWLPGAPRQRMLIGASIGAWRVAAACQHDPVAAFKRLGDLYCAQRYPRNPSLAHVSAACKELLASFIGGSEAGITQHPYHRPQLLTVRGRGWLQQPPDKMHAIAGFGAATLANLRSRAHLSHHLERVVIGDSRDPAEWLKTPFDAFKTHFTALTPDNLAPALLASGTLPLIMEPVQNIPQAPPGNYWDGGMIDYHLALPYSRLSAQKAGELVLYPHFTDHIVPGWLDKPMPWRCGGSAVQRDWLDNVIIVSPSPAFLRTLPRSKLPDRKDFHFYDLNHAARIKNWQQAIGQGERLRDALAAFAAAPDATPLQPLC